MLIGAAIFFIGAVWFVIGRFFPNLGRLPGDIVIRKGNFTFYFPLATCILISLALTFLSWIFRKP